MSKIISVIIVLAAVSGCTVIEEPINLSSTPPSRASEPNSASLGKVDQQKSIAESVNAALVWSQKYEKLMTEFELLKKQNEKMAQTNEKLKNDMQVKDKQLAQTEKELKEANELLLSMRLELNNWKKDVLGFREEMRQSQQALLAASTKILRELGAEIRQPIVENQQEQVDKND